MRGCWRPNVNFIFWPHCYDRHAVSFLISCNSTGAMGSTLLDAASFIASYQHLLWTPTHQGFKPLRSGVAFPTTSGLYCLELCWQLHRGFPRSPSVGCGLPYHIWSLLPGSLLATASGVFEVPLGRVWSSLPHLVSTVWKSAGNCSGTQTQLS